jgi:hypothetical protein
MCRHVTHARERAYAQAAISARDHLCHAGQGVDIENVRRKCRAVFHQTDEVCTARDEGRALVTAMHRDGVLCIGYAR